MPIACNAPRQCDVLECLQLASLHHDAIASGPADQPDKGAALKNHTRKEQWLSSASLSEIVNAVRQSSFGAHEVRPGGVLKQS